MVPPTGANNPNKHGFRAGIVESADGRIHTPKFDGFQMESSHVDKSAPKSINFTEKERTNRKPYFYKKKKKKQNKIIRERIKFCIISSKV